MKRLLIIALLSSIISQFSYSQGCVAIKSTGGFCTRDLMGAHGDGDQWLLNLNNKYFRSYKHFVGTDEQKQRTEQGTEVINHQYALDMNLTRILNARWSIMIDVPILSNARNDLYEHDNKNRYTTHSFGIGDVRVAVYKWLIDPVGMPKGNIQVGLGIKLPTGDYRVQDYFHKNDTTKILGPVDQSIQLGDGGTGFTGEINAFYNFNHNIGLYGNFYYLMNPREQNGVSTARGGTASASAIKNGSDVMSVPDQFMWRAGASFMVSHLAISLGAREECLTVHDLVGGSNGFRRPGFIISAEPGATYQFKKATFYAYVPVALVRNRTQSVPDKLRTEQTGIYAHGDAAFADYAVNIGCSFKF